MRLEGRRLRAVRYTVVGLANGVSLVFLAVLVTAYGSETVVPFTSVEEFLRVATVWAGGPREPTLAWTLGYLGGALVVLSPLWFLIVNPTVRSLLEFEFSTAPIERRKGGEETNRIEEDESSTTIDETGIEFVRGGGAGGESRKFTLEDMSEEDQIESPSKDE